jgi:signal transduction histidine kinase
VPVFYYALKRVMVNSVDENLITVKTRIMPQLLTAAPSQSAGSFNYPGYDVIFEKEYPAKNGDSMYSIELGGISPDGDLPSRLLASHFVVNKTSYKLQIKTSMVDKLSLIKNIVLILSALLIILLVGLIIINRVLTKRTWQPFYNTLSRLQAYNIDKQPALTFAPAPITEFNELNKAIEQLTERNYQAYASQKEFAENASHEMQSPLAVFQSKLEILMQTKPLNEEQATLITDLANASKRMSRLNKSLILLTKIDNNQFLEKETISVKDILQKLLQQYSFQMQQQSIQTVFNDAADITIDANRTLVEILVSNLLSNAIRHNIQGGTIQIELKEKQLVIKNTGKPTPLDASKIFQRFQKESPDTNSIGLGLEIVKKICTLNQYVIQYGFVDGMHSFTVRF